MRPQQQQQAAAAPRRDAQQQPQPAAPQAHACASDAELKADGLLMLAAAMAPLLMDVGPASADNPLLTGKTVSTSAETRSWPDQELLVPPPLKPSSGTSSAAPHNAPSAALRMPCSILGAVIGCGAHLKVGRPPSRLPRQW